MARSRKRPRYAGILAKPIEIPSLGALLLDESISGSDPQDRRRQYVMRELMARQWALFRHYDLEPHNDNAMLLVFKLACDWVPGFQVGGRRRGRPRGSRKGAAPSPLGLFFDVEQVRRAQPSVTALHALRQLQKTKRYRGRTLNSLRAHYREGARFGRKLLAVGAFIPGWEQRVFDDFVGGGRDEK